MDRTTDAPRNGAEAAAKDIWSKPRITSLNAGEALIPKDIDPEGGSGSILPV